MWQTGRYIFWYHCQNPRTIHSVISYGKNWTVYWQTHSGTTTTDHKAEMAAVSLRESCRRYSWQKESTAGRIVFSSVGALLMSILFFQVFYNAFNNILSSFYLLFCFLLWCNIKIIIITLLSKLFQSP